MHAHTWSRRQRYGLVLWTCLLMALALVGAAKASGYWDFQGNLSKGESYWESNPYNPYPPYTWGIRLSRTSCGTKMILQKWANAGNVMVGFPGGCATNDYSYYYDTSTYYASECYNEDGPTSWSNCRIDRTL